METKGEYQKKSNIIIFSGNGQTKNNENFQHGSETLPIADKQTYLGIEMTSSGRYTYAKDILSKKAYKVLAIVKRLFFRFGYDYNYN